MATIACQIVPLTWTCLKLQHEKRKCNKLAANICAKGALLMWFSLQCGMEIKMMEMKYLNLVLYFSASHRKHCKNVKSRIGHCSDPSPKVLHQDITSSTIILTAFFTVTENKMKKKTNIFFLKKKKVLHQLPIVSTVIF